MVKVKRYKKTSMILSPLQATLSSSWIPLTFAFLLYTSGITTPTRASESTSDASPSENETAKKNYTLTGNPQIDYVHDPNLPRELNGYNLSDYPFLNKVPKNINFSCDGLKDGFYASIEHKCQLYHHCLFGTRYDFLCANYTAFDQKTFICQFVSDIDCPNSALFFHRNNELYVTKSTTPPPRIPIRPGLYERRRPPPRNRDRDTNPAPAPANSSSSDPPAPAAVDERYPEDYDSEEEDYRPVVRRKPYRKRCKGGRRRCRNRRRRPRPRPRPVYYDDDYDDDYYDDYSGDYEDEDYEDVRPKGGRGGRRKDKLNGKNKLGGSKKTETEPTTTASTTTTTTTPQPTEAVSETLDVEPSIVNKNREEIFTKTVQRPPAKARVNKYERKTYDFAQGRSVATDKTVVPTTTTTEAPQVVQENGEPLTQQEDYYYDSDPADYNQQPVTKRPAPKATTPPAPKSSTLSSRQKFINKNFRVTTTTPKPTTTTTTRATTTSTTTTVKTTPVTSTAPTTYRPPFRERVTPRPQQIQTTPSTTTTTTEVPQYEYEYEYEDDISSTEKAPLIATTTTPTTTTTTTTTIKPSRGNLRGGSSNNNNNIKRPYQGIQTSTSVSQSVQDDENDYSQNAINRRQSATNNNNRGQNLRANTQTTQQQPPQRGNRQQQNPNPEPLAPAITVKSYSNPNPMPSPSSALQNKPTPVTTESSAVVRSRPSRFWQRPTKVVASTTENASDYSDYSDSEDPQSSPLLPPNIRYSQAPLAPQNSRFKSNPPPPPPTPSYNNNDPYTNNYRGQHTNSNNNNNGNTQQYLRPTQNTFRPLPPQTTNYIPNHSPFGPSPSAIGNYHHQIPQTTSSRPEFISLLREDEDPYYDLTMPPRSSSTSSRSSSSSSSSNNNNNFNRRLPVPPQRGQYFGSGQYPQKNLFSVGQETAHYHTILPAPARFSSIISSSSSNFRDFLSGPSMLLGFSPANYNNNNNNNRARMGMDEVMLLGGK